jgi:hypothetical protein
VRTQTPFRVPVGPSAPSDTAIVTFVSYLRGSVKGEGARQACGTQRRNDESVELAPGEVLRPAGCPPRGGRARDPALLGMVGGRPGAGVLAPDLGVRLARAGWLEA